MKKRVLFIIWSYSAGGGAESLLTMIVNHLNPQKYDIGILEYCHVGVKEEPVNGNITFLGAITSRSDPERRKKHYYLLNEPDRMVSKYIPSDYDLYVSFNYQIPSFLLPGGKRCIAWIHSDIYDLGGENGEGYLALQNEAFRKAKRIVSISDLTTRSLKELCPKHADKIREIYNGVDIDRVRQKAGENTCVVLEHPNILFVGRLEKRKNPVRLLNVLDILHKMKYPVHLYFLGQGDLSDDIEKISAGKGLSEYVHLLGYVQNPFPVIAQCDVNCLLSRTEGFSMALLEGVSLGKPFVSTYVGGAKILADGESCGKVAETDEQAAAAVMYWLNQDKKAVEKNCEISINRFGLTSYISRIETLFDEVLDEAQDGITSYRYGRNIELEEKTYYYRFPVEKVKKGERLIIYGAGAVGTDYCTFLQEMSLFCTKKVHIVIYRYPFYGYNNKKLKGVP